MATKQLYLLPKDGFDEEAVERIAAEKLRIKEGYKFQLQKRSIDARKNKVLILLQGEVVPQDAERTIGYRKPSHSVAGKAPIHIIGFGPAGMFAALRAIEHGYRPVVFERGKDVRGRRRDIAELSKKGIVNPESNYCFGEGGAGTYSDGKLYTRSKKRGDIERVLEMFVAHGASEDIMVNARPHIGTNKLPQVITALRETILEAGGEIHFDSKLTDLVQEGDKIKSIEINGTDRHEVDHLVLATGHSARDIYTLLHEREICIEAKPFALGVRIEHPQRLIDQIQYSCDNRGDYLPPAYYKLAANVFRQKQRKGIFSFCMCPGGFIVPSATAKGEVVVNGMSPSRRNGQFANSGLVISIDESDWGKYIKTHGVLAALEFQKRIERKAWKLGGGRSVAPAQRLVDYLDGKVSTDLPKSTYQPGMKSVNMAELFPSALHDSFRRGLRLIGNKMKGYLHEDAIMVGAESRTSSPVKIPRLKETWQHIDVANLYPVGEGAGYAGGIVSAAMDGMACMDAIKQNA